MNFVLVSGALAHKPGNGGHVWSRLEWVLGLQRFGFEVCFVEQIERGAGVDAAGTATSLPDSVNVAWFRSVMDQFELGRSCALLDEAGDSVYGLPLTDLVARARGGSWLLNMSGHLMLPALREAVSCAVYYDDDPGYTQCWHAAGTPGIRLEGHDFYYTVGQNIGAQHCAIPTANMPWRHTRPPVVLERWPLAPQPALDRFTTVASWRGAYGPVEFDGRTYGQKAHEFRKFVELPLRSGRACEIALRIHAGDRKDLDALVAHGWRVVDPRSVVGDPEAFRRYVQTSGAEFSVAQGIYVETNSGWFSDRTVRYLASGKPTLVQDTGFARNLPVGEGLLAFCTMEEAIEGAARIASDYPSHCWAARQIAEEHFDSDKVIGRLLDEIGIARP
jgi:hypothetical protein